MKGWELFFPEEKIILTGNPVRRNLLLCPVSKEDARRAFGLDPDKKTVLVVGGSLGARTINESIAASAERIIIRIFRLYGKLVKYMMNPQKKF